jgi:hypothetical protein
MNELHKDINVLARWVRRFSDQRLAEVFAFNEDGKLIWSDSCQCILGVTLAVNLHTAGDGRNCPEYAGGPGKSHYFLAKEIPGGREAEWAYRMVYEQVGHRWIMSGILSREMRYREWVRAFEGQHVTDCERTLGGRSSLTGESKPKDHESIKLSQ